MQFHLNDVLAFLSLMKAVFVCSAAAMRLSLSASPWLPMAKQWSREQICRARPVLAERVRMFSTHKLRLVMLFQTSLLLLGSRNARGEGLQCN